MVRRAVRLGVLKLLVWLVLVDGVRAAVVRLVRLVWLVSLDRGLRALPPRGNTVAGDSSCKHYEADAATYQPTNYRAGVVV